MIKPTLIKNFFPPEFIRLLQTEILFYKSDAALSKGLVEIDDRGFFRRNVLRPVLAQRALENMSARASEIFGTPVKPSYSYAAMYDNDKSICPKHKDRSDCRYSINLCVNQDKPWSIFIDGIEFNLEPGDAVAYSGTEHLHYRNQIHPGGFCDLIFFFFVDPEFKGSV